MKNNEATSEKTIKSENDKDINSDIFKTQYLELKQKYDDLEFNFQLEIQQKEE